MQKGCMRCHRRTEHFYGGESCCDIHFSEIVKEINAK